MFNVSYVASELITEMAHLSEICPPSQPLPLLPDRRGEEGGRRGEDEGEAGEQTTTGPVVIS